MDISFLLDLVGLFLTVMVLVYLLAGDNALFRLVTYTFVGVVSGYVAVVVIMQVLLPRLASLLVSGDATLVLLGAIEALLGVLLFARLSTSISFLGSLPLAALVGVGAAVAIGGAVLGTLFGQVLGTVGLFDLRQGGTPLARLLEGVFVLVGAITTLAYFQFTMRARSDSPVPEERAGQRTGTLAALSGIGQIFIGITLGAMFAGVYTAAISALVERITFVIDVTLRAASTLF